MEQSFVLQHLERIQLLVIRLTLEPIVVEEHRLVFLFEPAVIVEVILLRAWRRILASCFSRHFNVYMY